MNHIFQPIKIYLSFMFLFMLLFIFLPSLKVSAAPLNLNVADFGADGTDKKDDAAAIQKALDQAGEDHNTYILIPAGTYYISKTLYIQSNTYLTLNKDAVIKRKKTNLNKNLLRPTDSNHKSTNYDGYTLAHNIRISGGTWDGGNIKKSNKECNLLYFGHCENIVINNTTVKNCYGSHAIEFAGVNNGTISNCTISGFRYGSSHFESEAIQIDICFKQNSLRWAPGYSADGTVCNNITISNNTIIDYPRGIGSHHILEDNPSTNITITNNQIRRSTGKAQKKMYDWNLFTWRIKCYNI